MSTSSAASKDSGKQSDLLLWVAGGVVVAVGGAWLVLAEPWASAPQRAALTMPTTDTSGTVLALADPQPSADGTSGISDKLDDPLGMGRLAV